MTIPPTSTPLFAPAATTPPTPSSPSTSPPKEAGKTSAANGQTHTAMKNTILLGDCLDQLKTLEDESVDAVVTDPPYGLGTHEPSLDEIQAFLMGANLDTGGDFMGKDWEIPPVKVWLQVYRVLKPGGHLLSFGGTRSWDIISLGLRAAGFENRDTIAHDFPSLRWCQGQGLPKNLNISKEIDKAAGAEREVVGIKPGHEEFAGRSTKGHMDFSRSALSGFDRPWMHDDKTREQYHLQTAPATPEAKKHEGWGTALKPSWEPILVFRKPLKTTVVKNVLKHGTGGINIDGCRVGTQDDLNGGAYSEGGRSSDLPGANRTSTEAGMFAPDEGRLPGQYKQPSGRWPPNTVLVHHPDCKQMGSKKVKGTGTAQGSEILTYADKDGLETAPAWQCAEGCPVKALDKQTIEHKGSPFKEGESRSRGSAWREKEGRDPEKSPALKGPSNAPDNYGDQGAASRFFPQFKVDTPFKYVAKPSKTETSLNGEIVNDHPTKKPLELMRWLVRLVTPPGGIILDPYCGSATTLHAAREEGMNYVGIEKDEHSHKVATARMKVVEQQMNEQQHQYDAFNLAMNLSDDDD